MIKLFRRVKMKYIILLLGFIIEERLLIFATSFIAAFAVLAIRQLIIRDRKIKAAKKLLFFYDYNDRRYNREL